MTQGDVWNQALGLLGERSYAEGSESAAAVDLYWPQVLRLAYDYADWSFARRLVKLTTDGDGWLNRPGDALRVIRISRDVYGHLPVERMMRCGERILLDAPCSVWVEYVSKGPADGQDVPDTEPMFAQALVYLLAGACAMKLTQSSQMHQNYTQMGRQMLSDARFKDAQQDDSNKQRPTLLNETLGLV